MKRLARVAIVGRPNVGKSTLFNRITGKRRAIVHPSPGVTRDVQRIAAEWTGVGFELIDTGGLFSGLEDKLIREVESRALDEALSADVMVFVTDVEAGVTPSDVDVANQVRESGVPVIVAVNKCEKLKNQHAAGEFFAMGFDRVYPISALHGEGIGELLDEVVKEIPQAELQDASDDFKLAVVGRPNVGKSSLINALVGAETNIVDSRPGTTRDSLDLHIRWHTRGITLVDTAGIKRKAKTRDGLTSITALKSIDTISRADVVVMVLDASQGIANQDVKVASYVHKAGKGLVFCVNKWDLVDDKTNATVPEFEKRIRREFAFTGYAPILFVSALTHQRVNRILELAWEIGETRQKRITTSEVNRFVEEVIKVRPVPYYGGGTGKIYYATQVSVAPPTFALFVNKRAFFSRSYLRYINNQLRKRYPFGGTVIRIKLTERERRGDH
jgi:GTP-binding protein